MAQHNCPKCGKYGFTWRIEEETSTHTTWGCYQCGYSAFEDESLVRPCPCGEASVCRLEEPDRMYWWCCRCDKVFGVGADGVAVLGEE